MTEKEDYIFFSPRGLPVFTTLEHLRPIVASITTLIGHSENMEATYCVGSDVDVCRMFDQYLYKVRHRDILNFPSLMTGDI